MRKVQAQQALAHKAAAAAAREAAFAAEQKKKAEATAAAEETKINALEKAAAMTEYIGYPDWIANRTTLDLAYQGVNIFKWISNS